MDHPQLDNVVREVSALTRRNTSLDSVSGRVLAHSTLTPTSDRARIDSVLLGVIPDYVMKWEADAGVGTRTQAFHVPGRVEHALLDRVCIPLIVRGVRVGAIWVLADAPEDSLSEVFDIVNGSRKLFDRLAGQVLIALGTSNKLLPMYDRLLQSILEGSVTPFSEEYEQLFTTTGDRNLVVFSALHHAADQTRIPSLAYQQAMFDAGRSLETTVVGYSDDTHGVCLIPSDLAVETLVEQIEISLKLRTIDSSETRLEFGVSGKLSSWNDVRDHYLQASIALQATAVDPVLPSHHFSDVGIYRYFFAGSTSLKSARLELIRTSDDGGKLLHVLESVYDAPRQMQRVANLLHMHRTSIYNYLNRIEKLIGADPLDPLVRLELHAGLKASRWEQRPRLKQVEFHP